MKKLVILAVAIALIGVCGTAQAAKSWSDMSWWGNTGAQPLPVADSKGRAGYWWWPTDGVGGETLAVVCGTDSDNNLWGNRGIVFHAWVKPEDKKPVPPTPTPGPPPAPTRTKIMLNNVLFDFDKAVLKPEGKAEVDKLVAEFKKYGKDTVEIEGHTCDIGSDTYNMGLGQRRADSVKKYMVESGIAEARIKTVSYGETRPQAEYPNTSAANRKMNRRAVFNISLVN
jgi:outer membrane protein OmpA-like peptidoglycan-associated protein